MTRKLALSTLLVFALWSLADYLIHGLFLHDSYVATAQLWRPMDQLAYGWMYLSTFVAAAAFCFLYGLFVAPQGVASGLKYGVFVGIVSGFPMGFGSYAVMPIPMSLAVTWFLGTVLETVAGGILVGAIVGGCCTVGTSKDSASSCCA